MRVIATTANKVINRGSFVDKPSDNKSLFAPVCTNGITTNSAINSRRKSGPIIEITHNSKTNYCVSPADSLNDWDAARLRPPWLHSV